MKQFNNKIIIGIDHGYGNIKTANHCFKTGITSYDNEPLFTKDLLIYNGKYYLIGEGHKEFLRDKVQDNDYYCLTHVAIAMELSDANIYEADVIIAAGLPLAWTSGQKEAFAKYLSQNEDVAFTFRDVDYNIHIRVSEKDKKVLQRHAKRAGAFSIRLSPDVRSESAHPCEAERGTS